MNAWPFPPGTREVQVDERWAFVAKREAHRDSLDRLRGDDWDHTAVDPESRLLWCLVPGKRDGEVRERLIRQVHDRTGGRLDVLITSDEHAPYETSIRDVYGVATPRPRRPGPGRPPKPVKVVPPELRHATVRKRREKGRVVKLARTVVFGTTALLDALLKRSTASTTINTSFVERNNGTDRCQNSRKRRETYVCSKDPTIHLAVSFLVGDRDNHVWTTWEWTTRPAKTRSPSSDTTGTRTVEEIPSAVLHYGYKRIGSEIGGVTACGFLLR